MKKSLSFMLALIMVLCMIPGVALAAEVIDTWDGTVDTSWYNATDTEFVLTTAEQLAGLAKLVDEGNTFEGKTIKLGACLDLAEKQFNPIGSYRKDLAFKGTFDGDGHVIAKLSQNTWELDTGYYYDDLGLGLFAKVEDATIKNLKMDGASISGESALCGTVAATAYGDCTFENITVTNSEVADYQYYAGGIVGWASGKHQYINCDVDASTTIGGQWGDFGNANGGIIGGTAASATIYMKDCDVACRIDAVNDVVSAYQWYAYRNSGMLIGNTNRKATDDAVTNAAAPHLTCVNVTVTYYSWANYTYCEFAGTGYPYVRVQAGTSVEPYSNVRYGHPTDANGNTVEDDNHVHNDGEDHQVVIKFDQLYGGPAEHRYCTYGVATHDGVTVKYEYDKLAPTTESPYPCPHKCEPAGESNPSASPEITPAPKSSGSGISVKYNGGNSFSTSKPDVPTSVEIDNMPVSFTGNGSSFTVSGIPAGAKWVTVRWNSTSVTTNFTPDGAYFAEVEIPKTGDMPFWAAIAEFLGF